MRSDFTAALLALHFHFVHTCLSSQCRQTWIEPRPIRTGYVGRASPSCHGRSRGRHPFPRYTSLNHVNQAPVKPCPETILHNRKKDVGTPAGNWVASLMDPSPWFKDVVPNVSLFSRMVKFSSQKMSVPNCARLGIRSPIRFRNGLHVCVHKHRNLFTLPRWPMS
jgi:hypothetical protein